MPAQAPGQGLGISGAAMQKSKAIWKEIWLWIWHQEAVKLAHIKIAEQQCSITVTAKGARQSIFDSLVMCVVLPQGVENVKMKHTRHFHEIDLRRRVKERLVGRRLDDE